MSSIIPVLDTVSDMVNASDYATRIVAENLANQYTTKTENGGAYHSKSVVFESFMPNGLRRGQSIEGQPNSVKIGEVVKDPTPGVRFFNPHHPHADENGFVEMPNVRTSEQMVNLIKFSKWNEAGYALGKVSIDMARNAMSIGRA